MPGAETVGRSRPAPAGRCRLVSSRSWRALPAALLAVAVVAAAVPVWAGPEGQKPTRKPAAKPAAKPAPVVEPADMTCPNVLGSGVTTERVFCDVLTGLDPAEGILLRFPPRTGTLVLTFDLHNRHVYSASEAQTRAAFRGYTATIGVLTRDGQVATRGVVQTEFRVERDLFDRIADRASATGLKAVAPIGLETIRLEVPEGVDELSVLGERLTVLSARGTELFTMPGRPIAAISNVMVEYRPAASRK